LVAVESGVGEGLASFFGGEDRIDEGVFDEAGVEEFGGGLCGSALAGDGGAEVGG
jgi:hypothetical protein